MLSNMDRWKGKNFWQPWRLHFWLATVWLSCLSRTEAVTAISAWNPGIATNYGGPADGMDPSSPSFGTLEGSCGYKLLSKGTWPYWSVAALSTSNQFFISGPIQACGQCFEVQCLNSGGSFAGKCNTVNPVSVVVQITDSCPECEADHMDMQALTFNKLAPMAVGRIDIQYRRVECVPPSTIVVFVDNNNGPGAWLRLFIEQAGGKAAVSSVLVRTSSSSSGWSQMTNLYGSAWEIGQSPSYPLDISIVGPDGETITAFGVIDSSGAVGDRTTNAQFYITNPTDNLLTIPAGSSGGSATTPSPPSAGSSSSPPASPPPPPPSTPSIVTQGNSSQAAPPTATCSCTDFPTPYWPCADQLAWGKCSEAWMLAGDATTGSNGWCAKTCGRCKC